MLFTALHWITTILCACIPVVGGAVLYLGDWRKMVIKYAAVCLATAAGAWWLLAHFIIVQTTACPPDDGSFTLYCLGQQVMEGGVYMALILFLIATGRDSFCVSRGGRRAGERLAEVVRCNRQ